MFEKSTKLCSLCSFREDVTILFMNKFFPYVLYNFITCSVLS